MAHARGDSLRRVGRLLLVVGVVFVIYLLIAWLVVRNTEACWWPWHDILSGKPHLCSIGM